MRKVNDTGTRALINDNRCPRAVIMKISGTIRNSNLRIRTILQGVRIGTLFYLTRMIRRPSNANSITSHSIFRRRFMKGLSNLNRHIKIPITIKIHLLRYLRRNLRMIPLNLPLHKNTHRRITVSRLAGTLRRTTNIGNTRVRLTVMRLRPPSMLILTTPGTKSRSKRTTKKGRPNNVTRRGLRILISIRTMRIRQLFRVNISRPTIRSTTGLAINILTNLNGRSTLRYSLFVIMLAGVRIIIMRSRIHHAKTNTLQISTRNMTNAILFLVTHRKYPYRNTIHVLITPRRYGKLRNIIIQRVILNTNTSKGVRTTIRLDRVPSTTTMSTINMIVNKMIRRTIKVHSLNGALFQIKKSRRNNTTLTNNNVRNRITSSRLVLMSTRPTSTRKSTLLMNYNVVLRTIRTSVRQLTLINNKICLPSTKRGTSTTTTRATTRMRLTIVLRYITRRKYMAIVKTKRRRPNLTNPNISLRRRTLKPTTVLLNRGRDTIMGNVRNDNGRLIIMFITRATLRRKRNITSNNMTNTRVRPITMTSHQPYMILAPIANIMNNVLQIDRRHRYAISRVVRSTIYNFSVLFQINSLFGYLIILTMGRDITFIGEFQDNRFLPTVNLPSHLHTFYQRQGLRQRDRRRHYYRRTTSSAFPIRVILLVRSTVSSGAKGDYWYSSL